jgi:hypothetical protein
MHQCCNGLNNQRQSAFYHPQFIDGCCLRSEVCGSG